MTGTIIEQFEQQSETGEIALDESFFNSDVFKLLGVTAGPLKLQNVDISSVLGGVRLAGKFTAGAGDQYHIELIVDKKTKKVINIQAGISGSSESWLLANGNLQIEVAETLLSWNTYEGASAHATGVLILPKDMRLEVEIDIAGANDGIMVRCSSNDVPLTLAYLGSLVELEPGRFLPAGWPMDGIGVKEFSLILSPSTGVSWLEFSLAGKVLHIGKALSITPYVSVAVCDPWNETQELLIEGGAVARAGEYVCHLDVTRANSRDSTEWTLHGGLNRAKLEPILSQLGYLIGYTKIKLPAFLHHLTFDNLLVSCTTSGAFEVSGSASTKFSLGNS